MRRTAIKSAMIGARAYPHELQALRLVARREGRAVSDVLRGLVRARAAELGLWPLPQDALKGGSDSMGGNLEHAT